MAKNVEEKRGSAVAKVASSEKNLSHNVSRVGFELVVPKRRGRKPPTVSDLIGTYLETQVRGQAPSTVEQKSRDLWCFLDFYRDHYGHERPEEWYPSLTREFLRLLAKGELRRPSKRGAPQKVKPAHATVYRCYATIRHFARWADRTLQPFPFGCPTDGVKAPEEPKGKWRGMSRKDFVRLRNAAQNLRRQVRRGTNTGLRDHAFLEVLMGTGLRVSEVASLTVEQWDERGRCFRNVAQKGGDIREEVLLVDEDGQVRAVLREWLEQRGRADGPLFPTRSGSHLDRRQCAHIIGRMVDVANTHLPEEERIRVSPHTFRHAALRRIAREHGEAFALAQSCHRSNRYIPRYIQPNSEELRERLSPQAHV